MSTNLIGILGGSFDPIHNGHLHLAQEISSALSLSEVRFIPCSQNPLKSAPPKACVTDRLNLLKIALAPFKHFHVDEREINQTGPSYSIDTLKSLRGELGDIPLAFIMASDTFSHLPKWKDWEHITDYAHLIIAKRPGYEMPDIFVPGEKTKDASKLHSKPSGCIFFQSIKEQTPISATHIRSQNGKIVDMLPASVKAYIKKNKLY